MRHLPEHCALQVVALTVRTVKAPEEEAVDEFATRPSPWRASSSPSTPTPLLVVTGDHECGGLTIEGVDAQDETGTGDSVEDGPVPDQGQRQAVRDGLDDDRAHRRTRPGHRRGSQS